MDNLENSFLGSGWAFPVNFSAANYQLSLSAYENNINENIDIILTTRRGERILEPDFGSGLPLLLFRKMDETLKSDMIDTIQTSLRNNEPRISVKEVTVKFTDLLNGMVEIMIAYVFNQTNTRHNYVFPFSLNEGTNLRR